MGSGRHIIYVDIFLKKIGHQKRYTDDGLGYEIGHKEKKNRLAFLLLNCSNNKINKNNKK